MIKYTLCFVSMLMITGSCFGQDCAAPGCADSSGDRDVVKICCPEAKTETVKGHCYVVEEKEVCVPRFTFPWQKCEGPKCGYVIKVCVLRKKSTTKEKNGYDWKIRAADGCATGGCASNDCAAENCDTEPAESSVGSDTSNGTDLSQSASAKPTPLARIAALKSAQLEKLNEMSRQHNSKVR